MLFFRVGRLRFPQPDWVDLVPTVVELLTNTTGLYGSVVEFDVSMMRGPFSIGLRRDLRGTRLRSSFDRAARAVITLKNDGRTVKGGRVVMPLRDFVTQLCATTSAFLRRCDPRQQRRALRPLWEAFRRLVQTAEVQVRGARR